MSKQGNIWLLRYLDIPQQTATERLMSKQENIWLLRYLDVQQQTATGGLMSKRGKYLAVAVFRYTATDRNRRTDV